MLLKDVFGCTLANAAESVFTKLGRKQEEGRCDVVVALLTLQGNGTACRQKFQDRERHWDH